MAKNIGILTERRRAILKVVVQEYVKSAQPVSSGRIETVYGLGVSAATIRNELATLEEMGYLAQPHTSGGRVPTDRGYRYYVEGLMDEPAVPAEEQRTIAHQFHQVQMDLTEWLRLSAAILAQSVHNAALITAPKLAESHMKHLELISIQDSVALLVLVLQGGLVQQQMMMLPLPTSQDNLSPAAARLNRSLDGKTAFEIDQIAQTFGPGLDRDTAETVARLMSAHDHQDAPIVYYDGLANILGQQEFTVAAQAKSQERQQVAHGMIQMIDLLQQGLLFRRLLPQVTSDGGVQVFIGGEGEYEELRQFSVIVSRYGAVGGGTGMLGVLGPTRMHYGRAVAVVRYMTELLSELAGELNG
ncbi:MAG: heat-inducible transcription repressor HrcA [Chloroflexi bacterium]|nr:heat-inducible transcription repressor HrcA [Chloroflexota bacterium]